MPVRVVITERGATPKLARKELRNINAEGYAHAVELWHGQYLPQHFTLQGAQKYNYHKRKGENLPRNTKRFFRSYYGRKLREKGHSLPLVYSGVSERLSRIKDIRSTSKGAKAVLHCRGLRRKHPKSQINMADEVTRTTTEEEGKIVTAFGVYFHKRVNKLQATSTQTIS